MSQVFDTMKKRYYLCPNGHKLHEIRWGKDPLPLCHTCETEMEETYADGNLSAYVIGDDIPGGLEVKNGICNLDGSPRKVYSKTELKHLAYEGGWTVYGDTPKPNPRIVEKLHREKEDRRSRE